MSSEVPARALREIYLRPFEIALRESNPYSFMTGVSPKPFSLFFPTGSNLDRRSLCFLLQYNRLNGTHVSESKALIDGILRKEWGFEGMVMVRLKRNKEIVSKRDGLMSFSFLAVPLFRWNRIVRLVG